VRTDNTLKRGSAELYNLVGDASKARERLGWEATMTFEEIVKAMVEADLAALRAAEQEPQARPIA